MLHKIDKANISQILPLLEDDAYSVFAKAVLCGRAKGTVYLDNEINPTVAAILSSEEERCYFTLQNTDSVDVWESILLETVLRDQYEINKAPIEFFLHPKADESVHKLMYEMQGSWQPAYLYTYNANNAFDLQLSIPEGYTLQAIDNTFLTKEGIANFDLIFDEWEERNDNVDGVRGFCILKNNSIVSVCHIDFRFNDTIEIGIITEPENRRKGLARAVVANAIKYFTEHGINQIVWHAPKNNKGSCRVAEYCGFKVERNFGEYMLHYKLGYRLLMRAYNISNTGEFQEAASLYRKALQAEKNESEPFADFHSRFDVLSWILESYCELKNLDLIKATFNEISSYGINLTLDDIAFFESESEYKYLVETDFWKEFKSKIKLA